MTKARIVVTNFDLEKPDPPPVVLIKAFGIPPCCKATVRERLLELMRLPDYREGCPLISLIIFAKTGC